MTRGDAALAAKLQSEAEAWAPPSDLSALDTVDPDDLPVIDLGPYLAADPGDSGAIAETARQIRAACAEVGFMYVANHGLDATIERGYRAARAFHADLPADAKKTLAMNRDRAPYPRGVGFLAVANRVLPARALPNYNESFVVKRELGPRDVALEHMPWPPSVCGEGGSAAASFDGDEFKAATLALVEAYETLARKLLPVFAVALGLEPSYFESLFESPVVRMRLASYDATPAGHFGINPHVDTSFFTLLASTDFEGLVLFGRKKRKWLRATNDVRLPSSSEAIAHPLIVNTGQILCQLTNDEWTATRHFAVNPGGPNPDERRPRISLPFFFNASATAPLAVLPHFCSPTNPPKYATASYLDGQAVQQGE